MSPLALIAYIISGLVFFIGSLLAYQKAKAAPAKPNPDLLVTAGGFVDMEPVRDLAAQIMGATRVAEMAYREGKTAGAQLECIAEELERLREELKGVRDILSRMAEEERVNNQLVQRRGQGV